MTSENKKIPYLLLVFFALLPWQQKHGGLFKSIIRKTIPPTLELPPAFSRNMTCDWLDLLLICILVYLLCSRNSLSAFIKSSFKYLLLFLSAATLSIFFSSGPLYLFQYLRLAKFACAAMLFHAMCHYWICNPRYWYRLFATVCVITAAGLSLLGIAQYFAQNTFGLKWLGETSLSSLFANPSEGKWIFDAFVRTKTPLPFLARSVATFYHPNPFGGFLFFSLLMNYFLLLKGEKWRLLWQISLFIQLFALCTTFSRSAFLSLILATAPLLFFQRHSLTVKPFLLALLGSATVCITLFFPQLSSRGLFDSNVTIQQADEERRVYQHIALEMFKDHPICGVGFNNFQFYLPQYTTAKSPPHLIHKVHNIFLLILAETGLIGFFCFLLFLGSVFKRTIHHFHCLEVQISACSVLGFVVIGGCDMYLWEHPKLRFLFFASCALLWIATTIFPSKEVTALIKKDSVVG